MTMPDDPDNLIAAEYALGLLEGEERVAAMRRMLSDPSFAAEVSRWRDRLPDLLLDESVAPPPSLEARILRPVSPGTASWRWATAAALALAAGLGIALSIRPKPVVVTQTVTPAAIVYVATFAPEGGDPFTAIYDTREGRVRFASVPSVDTGRTLELWRIGTDGVPVALGVLAGNGRAVTISPAQRRAIAPGGTLALSVEPLGGSPTGQPTGPVVATGALSTI